MAKRGLGKGLDALFQTYEDYEPAEDKDYEGQILELRLYDIDPNEDQPRKDFDESSLEELSKSIMEHGVVQPIIVQPKEGRYTIVAGERRWRAARLAGLDRIPAIVRSMDERELLEIALIENLQREDLNPMEEAEGIDNLMKNYGLTQDQVAKRLGKSRPAIANSLRLLKLPSEVRKIIEEGTVTSGHGRALLGLSTKEEILKATNLIIQNDLSVRETENLIKNMKKAGSQRPKPKAVEKPSYLLDIENKMEESLGTRVTIQSGKKKGVIEIEYYSDDDLERIIGMFTI